MTESEKSECNWIVSYVEKKANWRFPPGFDPAIVSARLTFDPLFATQRPFFFYLTIAVVNYLTHGILWLVGYSRRREYDVGSQSIYHRPSRAAKKGLPIIFIHGIGIGFPHYLGLILSFPQDCDVYLVEWPHVAMQFSYSVPTIDDTVGTITRVLRDDRHPAACFIGHSLGTTAVSWMLKSASAHLVASSILIDPVTFLLCDPTVATSFVYNDPETTLDFMMHFFVSRELFIANALSRHFNWSQNIMFVEDLAANVRDNPISEALPTVQHTVSKNTHTVLILSITVFVSVCR